MRTTEVLLMGDDALRSTAPVATALCVVDKNERAIGPWLQIRALFRQGIAVISP
jgi:hypothetical protein